MRGQADRSVDQARLVREARLVGSLSHPGILPVFQLNRSELNVPFYTMPLIRGETLQKHVASDPSELGERERIVRLVGRFAQICHAVAYAHDQGVCHRDIKPENILLADFGRTYLVDWGMAKRIGEPDFPDSQSNSDLSFGSQIHGADEQLTADGASIGTPAYMSPEQALGTADSDFIKSDIFNLGATLYFVLTGKPPYQGRTLPEIISKAIACQYRSPRQLNSRIPTPLESVCLRALSKNPDSRYESVAQMREEIECWLADRPIASHRESIPETIARWNRNHSRWVAILFAMSFVVAATAVVAFVLIGWQKKRSDENTQLAWQTVNSTVRSIADDEALKFSRVRSLRERLLSASLQNYKQLLEKPANRPALAGHVGEAWLQSGRLKMELGQFSEAVTDLTKAKDSLLMSFKRSKDVTTLEKFAEAYLLVAKIDNGAGEADYQFLIDQLQRWSAQFPKSDRLQQIQLETILLAAAKIHDPSKIESWLSLVESGLSSSNHDPETAQKFQIDLSLIRAETSETESRRSFLEEAIAGFRELVEAESANADHQLALGLDYGLAIRNRAKLAADAKEIIFWLEKEESLYKMLAAKFPGVIEFQTVYQEVLMKLAPLYRDMGSYDRQLKVSESAVMLNTRIPNSTNTGELVLANALIDVANWHRQNGRPQESQFHLIRAAKILNHHEGRVPEATQQTLGQNLLVIGVDQWMYGDAQSAQDSFFQSASVFKSLLDQQPDNVSLKNLHATSLMAIGLSETMQNKLESSADKIRQAIGIFDDLKNSQVRGSEPRSQPNYSMALHTSNFLLATVLQKLGKVDQAEEIRMTQQQFQPESPGEILGLAQAYAWESQIYGRGKDTLSETDLFVLKRYHLQTIELLQAANKKGPGIIKTVKNDPRFDPLYRYESFRELIGEETPQFP